MTEKYVIVVAGGDFSEGEISLETGNAVLNALLEMKYKAKLVELHGDIVEIIRTEKPDVVFNASHGVCGEDGVLQGFLEMMRIPYTHSPVLGSALSMDKRTSKIIMEHLSIPTAKWYHVSAKDFIAHGSEINYPYVVKQNNGGSSYNVCIVHNKFEEEKAKELFLPFADYMILIVEEFVFGKEIAVPVINGKVCDCIELYYDEEFFSYNAKYGGNSRYTRAEYLDDQVQDILKNSTKKLYDYMGLSGVARGDFRYNHETNEVAMLEINAQPGLCPVSIIPKVAQDFNVTYNELIDMLVKSARCHVKGEKRQ